ncbi:MAG: hypothetical protein HRU46_03790 [Verrucomicrobiales bacterium]|nr:hypothetical protein [Verrucomicrobiales bacterium]
MTNESTPRESGSRMKEFLALGILLISIVAITWPGLSSPRVLDDTLQYDHVALFDGWMDCFTEPDCFGLMRPPKNLIYYAFYRSGSDSLALWHGLNLGAHLLAVVALFALFRRLLGDWRWALASTSVWAITPTMACASIWMSCININLGIALLVPFLLIHLRAGENGSSRIKLTILANAVLFISLFFYESLIIAVGLAFLCDRLLAKGSLLKGAFTKSNIPVYASYCVVTVGYFAIRAFAGATQSSAGNNLGFPPDTEAWQVFVSAPWFLVQHFMMWLMPYNRIEFVSAYIWGESTSMNSLVMSWVIMIAAIATCLATWKKNPLFAFGILWFGVASFPPSNFIPIFSGPIEDYYVTIPSIGLALSVCGLARAIWSIRDSKEWQNPKLIVTVLIVSLVAWRATLIPLYHQRANLWNDAFALYFSVIETRPHQYQAKILAATELVNRGLPGEALVLSKEAIDEASWNPGGHLVTGFAHSRLEQFDEADESLSEAIKSNKLTVYQLRASQYELARIAIIQERFDDARTSLLELLETGYDHEQRIPAILLMSELYQKQAKPDKAVATIEKGLGLYPDQPDLVARLGMLSEEETIPGVNLDPASVAE